MKMFAAAAMAVLLPGAVQAQMTYWPAPGAERATAYLPIGTPLRLVTRTQLSTKDDKPGDRFYLDVAESLVYRGQVVVPAGAVAVGEVARSDRNGHFGKKGKLDIRILYVETPTGPVRLGGQANDEGTSGTAVSLATMAFVSSLGFLIHGTSAHLANGTVVEAYLADDLRFTVEPAQAQLAMVQPDAAGFAPAR